MKKDVIKRREKLLGSEFVTNSCDNCFIIDYKGTEKVLVAFHNPFCIVRCSFANLIRGNVKNPMMPTFCGVGYIGIGPYGAKDKKAYNLWYEMLRRTINNKNLPPRSVSYKDVTVCSEWLCFQNFAKWYYDQSYHNCRDDKGRHYHLDKDLLVKGNRNYSPDKCCLLPQDVNLLIVKNNANRGELPLGVHAHKPSDKFIVQMNRYGKLHHVGLYETAEEAFLAYKKAKEIHIKEVAEKWKGKIDVKVYQALINYEVCIDD